VGHRAGLEEVEKRKIPIIAPAANRTPIVQAVS